MLYLLNPKVWIAVVVLVFLAGTHVGAYRSGRAAIQTKWDLQVAKQKEEALKAEQAARSKEQALVAAKDQAEKRYAELKKQTAVAVAGAKSELDGLRNELAAAGSAASQDASACPRTASRAGLESELLGHCAKTLVGLAEEADRLEALVVGLQGYVKNVCLAK